MSGGYPIFEAKHESMQTHAVNGALAIAIAQCVKLPFQAASLLVLPRLLQPIDYGVYAMINPIVSISALILNFGIGQALIQAPFLRRDEVSGLFWITAPGARRLRLCWARLRSFLRFTMSHAPARSLRSLRSF